MKAENLMVGRNNIKKVVEQFSSRANWHYDVLKTDILLFLKVMTKGF